MPNFDTMTGQRLREAKSIFMEGTEERRRHGIVLSVCQGGTL